MFPFYLVFIEWPKNTKFASEKPCIQFTIRYIDFVILLPL